MLKEFDPGPGDLEYDAHYDPTRVLQKWDVFGFYDHKTQTRIGDGLVFRKSGEYDPVFEDNVPWKSVTVLFNPTDVPEEDVIYWLSYVHGGPYTKRRKLLNGKVAIRSDYQAW